MSRQNSRMPCWLAIAMMLGSALPPVIAEASQKAMDLTITSFDLSGRQLALPLPDSGRSKDMPRFIPILAVDVDGEVTPLLSPLVMLKEMWDWKSGFLSLQNRGSMAVNVVVRPAPAGVALYCEPDLRRMLEIQLATKLHQFEIAGGQERYKPHLSIMPDPVQLDGAKALSYVNKGYGDWESYIIPVTKKYYLSIDFTFFAADKSASSHEWRQLAEKLKTSIVRGMRFRGNWVSLQDCSK